MKIGDLVVSKAHQNHSSLVPAKLVIQVQLNLGHAKGTYIVTADEPDEWKPAHNFFVVSTA